MSTSFPHCTTPTHNQLSCSIPGTHSGLQLIYSSDRRKKLTDCMNQTTEHTFNYIRQITANSAIQWGLVGPTLWEKLVFALLGLRPQLFRVCNKSVKFKSHPVKEGRKRGPKKREGTGWKDGTRKDGRCKTYKRD